MSDALPFGSLIRVVNLFELALSPRGTYSPEDYRQWRDYANTVRQEGRELITETMSILRQGLRHNLDDISFGTARTEADELELLLVRLVDQDLPKPIDAVGIEDDGEESKQFLFENSIRHATKEQFQEIRAVVERLQHWRDCVKPHAGDVAKEDEGGTSKSKGVPLAEAEIRVREWLAANAKDDPAAITRDAVAAGTKISNGQVSNTAAWKAFSERRDAEKKPRTRSVPLTDHMQAVIPASNDTSDELARLIEEQQADEARDEQQEEEALDTHRHGRRHGSS